MPDVVRIIYDHNEHLNRDDDQAHSQYLLKTGQDVAATHYPQKFNLGIDLPLGPSTTGLQ